jgi:hypothetical protein
MSRIRANKITDKIGTGAIELEKGAHLPIGMGITGAGGLNITGVVTATSFSGSGAGLTGIDATSIKDSGGNVKIQGQASGAVHTGISTFQDIDVDGHTNLDNISVSGVSTFTGNATFSGNVSIGGTLTYEDVTNIDSVGIITARSSIKLTNASANSGNFLELKTNSDSSSDIIKAGAGAFFIKGHNIFVGDDDTNKVYLGGYKDNYSFLNYNNNTKIRTEAGGVFITGVCTATSFVGDGSALTGIEVGISTEALTGAGSTVTLDLSKDDHKITKSGTYTITCTGGAEASSHTLRIVNSGIATVGFSTYFLFPSGGTPVLPTASGSISLISFTVHRAGAVGVSTQLLSGSSINFS